MALIANPNESEIQIIDNFLKALDRIGVEYEHYPEGFVIKIKGYIVRSVPFVIPELIFEQNKSKRVIISRSSEGIRVRVFDKKKPMPVDLLFPAKWHIEYDKPYLKINY